MEILKNAIAGDKEDKARAEKFLLESANISHVGPRPGYKELAFRRILERLSREEKIGSAKRKISPGFSGIVRRAVIIPLVALVIVALLTSGAYAFSHESAPDSILYPVKRFFEKTGFRLTGGSQAKVCYQLGLLNKRMREMEDMVARGSGRGGSRWQRAYQESREWLLGNLPSLEGIEQEELDAYLESLLGDHIHSMEELKGTCSRELLHYLTQVQEENREAVQLVRQRQLHRGPEEMTPGSSGRGDGSGNDYQGNGGTAPGPKGGEEKGRSPGEGGKSCPR